MEKNNHIKKAVADKIDALARSFLLHEKPFDNLKYLTAYDRYKKYILEESGDKFEYIINLLVQFQKKIFFDEVSDDQSVKEVIEKFESKYQFENQDITSDLPDSLHRIKRKTLRLIITKMIGNYFMGFKYDSKPYELNDPRSIVFSRKVQDQKQVIDFYMGPYGAGLWCNIYVGYAGPMIRIDVARYIPLEFISYNDISECEIKMRSIFEITKVIADQFLSIK